MTANEKLIEKFYTAFQNKDYARMAACYHDEVRFSDPVFTILYGSQAKAMWHMLVERGQGEAGQLRAQVAPAGPDREYGIERHAGRDDDEGAPYQVVRQSHGHLSLGGRAGPGDSSETSPQDRVRGENCKFEPGIFYLIRLATVKADRQKVDSFRIFCLFFVRLVEKHKLCCCRRG
jgi:ketosteroid isomerase-like protein